jgi:hypothetical protein
MLLGRTPTAEEQRHMQRVQALGCIICRIYGKQYTPAEIHHLDGKTKHGAHKRILPLCPPHHRLAGKGYVSWANGKKAFEEAYMPAEDLLVCVDKALELEDQRTISTVRGRST